MSALSVIEAILSAAAPVTALVADRIFYTTAPQGAPRPYLVLIQTVERDEPMLGGMAGYPESMVNVSCYADDFPAVEALGNAVIATLQDAAGTWRGKTATLQRDDVDSFDFLPADKTHRRITGFAVRYR
jgi:hypothetical protein